MAVKDIAASVLAKLRNQAIQERINYQICLQLFVQEEFLRRLSHSAYKDKMVLKGGMFIYTLTSFKSRPTRDIDFLVTRLTNDLFYLSGIFDFDGNVLQDAIRGTMEHRDHTLDPNVFDRIRNFPENQFLQTQWKAFTPAKEMDLSLEATIERMESFIFPVLESIQNNNVFTRTWTCSDQTWIYENLKK